MKLNKLATNDHQEIPLENKILALRAAETKLIKQKLDENNQLHLGFDANKKRYQDLQGLVVSFEENLNLIPKLVDEVLNKWTIPLSDLTPSHMFYVDSYALASKGVCKKHPIYVNRDLTKHADITLLLANNNINPSFEYQETFCTLSGGNYEIYSDGTFDYDQVYISYIRYTKPIDFPGYTNLDGSSSSKQDSELEAYLEEELIDLTVQDLAISTENIPAAQGSGLRIAQNE